jgi:hypothetical protein
MVIGTAELTVANAQTLCRKPPNQQRGYLNVVSDLVVQGGVCALEVAAIFNHLSTRAFDAFCVSGMSMGGYIAAALACASLRPIACVPGLVSDRAS